MADVTREDVVAALDAGHTDGVVDEWETTVAEGEIAWVPGGHVTEPGLVRYSRHEGFIAHAFRPEGHTQASE